MTPTTNLDDTLPIEGGSLRRAELVADLRRAHRPVTHLSRTDDAVTCAIHAGPREMQRASRSRRLRLRLGAPLAAALALGLGLAAYVHQQAPASVSAQTILTQAAKAGLIPNQVTRFVYSVSSSTGYAGTSTFWVQANANGVPQQIATGATDPVALHLARAMEVDVAASQLTGQATLDGARVDVIQAAPGGPITYVDAQSYLIRGADWTEREGPGAGSTWTARLLQYGTVPAASVPATASWHRHNPTA